LFKRFAPTRTNRGAGILDAGTNIGPPARRRLIAFAIHDQEDN
jgi:hypothetical protein